MNETYGLLRRAIVERKQVFATYGGMKRKLCPHILGRKEGHERCWFYQFGGESKQALDPGSPRNWRCLPVEGLSDVSIHDGPWFSGPNFSLAQNCIDEIDVLTEPDQ